MKYTMFIEVDSTVLEFIKSEKISLDLLLIISYNTFKLENFSCIISSNTILKRIIIEKEIFFLLNHFAKILNLPLEIIAGEFILESYLYLIKNGD